MASVLDPAANIAVSGFAKFASYAKFLIPLVIIALLFGIVWLVKKSKQKKKQWTHELIVQRVINDQNDLSPEVIYNMRRFPLIKRAEIFELEKPFLGGYLIPELEEYAGMNKFKIILDKNNRIYTNKGAKFCPDKSCVNVSAKHSEIDIQRSSLNAKFRDINKVNKRLEWGTIAKYASIIIVIVALMVVALAGISKWGEAQVHKAKQAQAEAMAMQELAKALSSMEGVVNTQDLIIVKLQELYGTKNIQGVIKRNQENVANV